MVKKNKKILVLGITGMLGNAIFRSLSEKFNTWGTVRTTSKNRMFPEALQKKIISDVDVLNDDQLVSVLSEVKPDVVINCVGIIKQLSSSKDPLVALPINAMLPHRLARLCSLGDARLIHISTDCVFSGDKGMYSELDISDAQDLYGKSKYIGELSDLPNCITLRTSIIGHELASQASLVDWFLAQKDQVNGYTNAVFSGLPTIELATVIRDFVIPKAELQGLYHVSAEPIDKYALLSLVAEIYHKNIKIREDTSVVIDRSLDSSKFKKDAGYEPPSWPDLVNKMHEFYKKVSCELRDV